MTKALDVAYVRYQVPDLDRMEAFLVDFGLARAARTGGALYMRAAGSEPFAHETVQGADSRFLGGALAVESRADLERLARLPGSSAIEPIDAPGGGLRVRMRTPDGVAIDAVTERQPATALPLHAPSPFNAGVRKDRRHAALRPKREPGAHDYLAARGHKLDCGVGRHLLGSQIFDYWRDPFGFRLEHFTDGDVANNEHRPSRFSGTADQTTQWGMNPSPDFFE